MGKEFTKRKAQRSVHVCLALFMAWFPGEKGDQEVPSEVLKVMNKHLFLGSHKAPIFKSMLPWLI